MQNLGIVGKSEATERLKDMIRIAARAIHLAARRPADRFALVCCGALTDTLAESELFGHVQGAFTGARDSRGGIVSQSKDGTLFLNEIGVLPLRLQAKFLHLIEGKEYRPVGGTRLLRVEAQIVAATNMDLHHAVCVQRFLPDLLDRLTVFPIVLPPLRERREDVPVLLRHFFGRAGRYDLWRSLDDGAVEFLATREWPGNVRQLRNLVTRLVMRGDGVPVCLEEIRREYTAGEVIVRHPDPPR